MAPASLPRIGDKIAVDFTGPHGHLSSRYIGTVTDVDSHGVGLANVRAYDVPDDGAPYWYELAEIGLAWPRRSGVRTILPHRYGCVCSVCHDYS